MWNSPLPILKTKSTEQGKDDRGIRQITYQLVAAVLSPRARNSVMSPRIRLFYLLLPPSPCSIFREGESTTLPNSHILLTKVRKRCFANINTSDVSLLHFSILQVQSTNKYPGPHAFLMKDMSELHQEFSQTKK